MKFVATVPPAARGGRTRYVAEAAELRANPGRWGLLVVGSKSGRAIASNISRGLLGAFPAGQFEASSRTNPAGGFDVYVRFIGKAA